MRSCALCHAQDRPQLIEDARCNCKGGDCEGHSGECQKIEHWVQRDIQLQGTPLTKKQKDSGWRERPQGFRGKSAIERFICETCARKQDDIAELVNFRKRKLDELNPDKVDTMYQILCD